MQDLAEHFDVVVIGGGAAGLMCAITAGRRGRRVALLEHGERVGKKIEISGGGRCNFTNLGATAANFLSERPEFCKSALARYSPWDFVAMVERFRLETTRGALTCDALVVATGGLSFAKLGATDFGHRLARQFGLRVTELRPGLVPLTFAQQDSALHTLSGLSLPVVARCGDAEFAEAMLFTHRGVSGPAVLQISSFWREGETVFFDLLAEPGAAAAVVSARAMGRSLDAVLAERMPRRFVEAWCARHALAKTLVHYKQREFDDVIGLLRAWPFRASGTEGYPKAEVTLGGVDTGELSSKTMEARRVPGLFFIGEVVDVTGWLGGYNFQWAWASGHAAGEAV